MSNDIKKHVVEITDVGNFNVLNVEWYSESGEPTRCPLEVGEKLLIKVIKDALVPGGVYSHITRTDKSYTTVIGDVLQDRNDPKYQMRNDRFRLLYDIL